MRGIRVTALPNNVLQRTALRAAAEHEIVGRTVRGLMNWRFSTTIVLIAVLADAGVSGAPRREIAFSMVSGKGYRGVIFPKAPLALVGVAGEGTWCPSPIDVSELEGLLAVALKNTLSDSQRGRDILGGPGGLSEKEWFELRAYQKAEIVEILPQLGLYRRQYAGILKGKRRVILVNFFPEGDDRPNDYLGSGRSEWISVKGGGTSYWHVRFDVKDRRFDEFWANAPK